MTLATWEAEAEGSLEFRSSRPPWATQTLPQEKQIKKNNHHQNAKTPNHQMGALSFSISVSPGFHPSQQVGLISSVTVGTTLAARLSQSPPSYLTASVGSSSTTFISQGPGEQKWPSASLALPAVILSPGGTALSPLRQNNTASPKPVVKMGEPLSLGQEHCLLF